MIDTVDEQATAAAIAMRTVTRLESATNDRDRVVPGIVTRVIPR